MIWKRGANLLGAMKDIKLADAMMGKVLWQKFQSQYMTEGGAYIKACVDKEHMQSVISSTEDRKS